MVYNRRRTTMKKTILMGIAALVVCGSVNATSWRVCSKTEAGANFLSVADAVASNTVFAGDTLYIEPGHVENNAVTISKALVLIGPGYMFSNNNINMMNINPAIFNNRVQLSAGCKIYGVQVNSGVEFADNCIAQGCYFTDGCAGSGTNITMRNCYVRGQFYSYNGIYSSLFEGNIFLDAYFTGYNGGYGFRTSTFRNNTIIGNTDYNLLKAENCEIYNNIIINISEGYSTSTNVDQTIDTTFKKWNGLEYSATNNVHHNILSNKPVATYSNCIFNSKLEDVLVMGGNNEDAYKHKANGPAVGSGVGGSTIGAYGNYGGGTRPYSLSGIPQYRPYIYDAQIDETPSSNNTINASFKIKVQQ